MEEAKEANEAVCRAVPSDGYLVSPFWGDQIQNWLILYEQA